MTSNNRAQQFVGEQTEDRCSDCGGRLSSNGQELHCASCGLIVAENPIDTGPEWREYNVGDRSRRRGEDGGQPRLHNKGLGSHTNHLSQKKDVIAQADGRRQLVRRHYLDRQSNFESGKDWYLAQGLTEVQRMSTALGLGDSLIDNGCTLFRQAQDEDLLLGCQSLEEIASACVYAICRIHRRNLPPERISRVSKVDPDKIRRGYNTLNTELEIPAPPPKVSDILPRLASDLEVDAGVEKKARAFAQRADDSQEFISCSPSGVAGACLYLALVRHSPHSSWSEITAVTWADLEEVTGSSRLTINKHVAALRTAEWTNDAQSL
jgi:transcription initiation factor TFIIB